MADPVTWMVIATVATTGFSIYQSQQQNKMYQRNAEAQAKQTQLNLLQQQSEIRNEATTDEINRLRALRATLQDNIISTIGSGATIEGTPMNIIEGNIETAREDISNIRLNAESASASAAAGAGAQIESIETGAANYAASSKMNQVGSLLGGGVSIAGSYAKYGQES